MSLVKLGNIYIVKVTLFVTTGSLLWQFVMCFQIFDTKCLVIRRYFNLVMIYFEGNTSAFFWKSLNFIT